MDARQAQSVRDKARRAAARMRREARKMQAGAEKKALQEQVRRLSNIIESSTRSGAKRKAEGLSRKSAKDVRAESLQKLSDFVQSGKLLSAQDRRNEIYKERINTASRSDDSMESMQVKIFFRATQQYWQGQPQENRLDLILAGLGTTSLKVAWDLVMARNRQVLQDYSDSMDIPEEDTMDFYEGAETETDDGGSPIILASVIQV